MATPPFQMFPDFGPPTGPTLYVPEVLPRPPTPLPPAYSGPIIDIQPNQPRPPPLSLGPGGLQPLRAPTNPHGAQFAPGPYGTANIRGPAPASQSAAGMFSQQGTFPGGPPGQMGTQNLAPPPPFPRGRQPLPRNPPQQIPLPQGGEKTSVDAMGGKTTVETMPRGRLAGLKAGALRGGALSAAGFLPGAMNALERFAYPESTPGSLGFRSPTLEETLAGERRLQIPLPPTNQYQPGPYEVGDEQMAKIRAIGAKGRAPEPMTAEPAPQHEALQPDSGNWYTVQEGDTLSAVAKSILGPQAKLQDVLALARQIATQSGVQDMNKVKAGVELNLGNRSTTADKVRKVSFRRAKQLSPQQIAHQMFRHAIPDTLAQHPGAPVPFAKQFAGSSPEELFLGNRQPQAGSKTTRLKPF